MEKWLFIFKVGGPATVLTLKDQSFRRTDCEEIARGAEKLIYKHKNQETCFFIPNQDSKEHWKLGLKGPLTSNIWNARIEAEKKYLDQIISLGLRAQHFEIAPLTINQPNKPGRTINVLLAKNFETLAKEESIVIYNKKSHQLIGNPVHFADRKEQFRDPVFMRAMLKKLIEEYAICLTFGLPITPLKPALDDSEHYCFELSQTSNEPPIMRYMFWDVVADFNGINNHPIVPTLQELKAGYQKNNQDPLIGLKVLAHEVNEAIQEIVRKENPSDLFPNLEKEILSAIDNDDYLQQALHHAKMKAAPYINSSLSVQEEIEEPVPTPNSLPLSKTTDYSFLIKVLSSLAAIGGLAMIILGVLAAQPLLMIGGGVLLAAGGFGFFAKNARTAEPALFNQPHPVPSRQTHLNFIRPY